MPKTKTICKIVDKQKYKRTVGADQKTFTRSHEAADIYTDTVTHSSHLNMSYYGFRQVQQTVHFTSSIKITLTMTTDIKNQFFTMKNPLLIRHYLQLKDCANILNLHYYTTQTVFQGLAKQIRWSETWCFLIDKHHSILCVRLYFLNYLNFNLVYYLKKGLSFWLVLWDSKYSCLSALKSRNNVFSRYHLWNEQT